MEQLPHDERNIMIFNLQKSQLKESMTEIYRTGKAMKKWKMTVHSSQVRTGNQVKLVGGQFRRNETMFFHTEILSKSRNAVSEAVKDAES